MPALGFAIIGEQFETFHLLLQCENLDKSITGVRAQREKLSK